MGKKNKRRKNRYKKHARQKRQRWVRRFMVSLKLLVLMVLMLAVSALFMAGYAAVTRTAYFKTQSIQVKGMQRLSQKAVLAQAGIGQGDNLLAVNLRLVRKRLLAHPWIAAARVAREIPETIIIEVAEHNPLAVVDLGRRFLMNDQGRIFKEHTPDDPKGLPLVTGIAYADISLGDDALTSAVAAVVDVLRTSRAPRSVLSFQQIRQVVLDHQMGITLIAWKTRRTIKLGFADYDAKFNRLKQLLPHLKQRREWRQFSAIDVNNPDRVVVKLTATPNKGA